MNLELRLKNGVLSALPGVLEGTVVDQKMAQTVSTYERPSFQQVLNEIGLLPEEALCMGLAQDGLPVLLNLWDPLAGPILVAGDSQSGKTHFLQTLSRFAVATHAPGEIQYGVITNHSHQWDDYAGYPHCIGIFPAGHRSATDFIHALAAWMELNQNNRQSVLLLIDELDDLLSSNSGLTRELQRILLSGPTKKIWPFVTINMERVQTVKPWLKYFHTRVFGYTEHIDTMDTNCQASEFESLSKGVEFCFKESSQWLKFWIPGR